MDFIISMDNKKIIRQEILSKRKTLSSEYYHEANKEIIKKLISLKEFIDSKVIFMFVGLTGEVNTKPIKTIAQLENKVVAIPKIYPNREMKAHKCLDWETLSSHSFGVLEPDANSEVISKEQIDLIIIPCVSCDNEGHRLGYGGGYYDRYLQDSSAIKVLPCFSKLQSRTIPTEKHDIQADIVITEKGIYRK